MSTELKKPKKQKDKRKPIYSVDLSKKEYDGSCDLAFFDVVLDSNFYIVRYYGVCAIYSADSLTEAKNFIWKRIREGK